MASPLDREAIMTALFALVDGAFAWATSSRLLQAWSSVASFPAMYVVHLSDRYLSSSSLSTHRPTGLPPQIYLDAEVWLYTLAGPNQVPETAINQLIDVVEGALQGRPARSAQTLGGLVRHAWIDGTIAIDAGHLDGKGKAVIPVRMLAPGVSPPGVAIP
jgi:hypothetical protein